MDSVGDTVPSPLANGHTGVGSISTDSGGALVSILLLQPAAEKAQRRPEGPRNYIHPDPFHFD